MLSPSSCPLASRLASRPGKAEEEVLLQRLTLHGFLAFLALNAYGESATSYRYWSKLQQVKMELGSVTGWNRTVAAGHQLFG